MKKIKNYAVNFSKYSSVGLIITLCDIFFSWLFIDIIGMKAILSSSIIETFDFTTKYIGYRKFKLIRKKFNIFLMITLISIFSFILLSHLLIDLLSYPTLIVIPFLIGLLFLLRFFALYWTKIICD